MHTLEDNLSDIKFIKGDIRNKELVDYIFKNSKIDYVINFAAESHVDRSIESSRIFLETNILGTQILLEVAKGNWQIGEDKYRDGVKFIQISTDEVYGSIDEGYFIEETPLAPRSPYAASKAGADMLVKSYYETYKFPVIITRCSNNYGPYQFPEKLIPLMIKNTLQGRKLPVYGNGKNVRDWIYVEDHIRAIDLVINKGVSGEIYNIGSNTEYQNIDLVKLIINIIRDLISEKRYEKKKNFADPKIINYNLIEYVKDRLGHDKRYAIDASKIQKELGWKPEVSFDKGIIKTVEWYIENQEWIEQVSSSD